MSDSSVEAQQELELNKDTTLAPKKSEGRETTR